MERRIVNPWTWQDEFGYVQANEVRNPERWLVCAGQTSVDAEGRPVHAGDMTAQVMQAIDNLEEVLRHAGFTLADVVRVNIYTTDVAALTGALPAVGPRLAQAGCRYAGTLLGVSSLAFPELMVELEATAVA